MLLDPYYVCMCTMSRVEQIIYVEPCMFCLLVHPECEQLSYWDAIVSDDPYMYNIYTCVSSCVRCGQVVEK